MTRVRHRRVVIFGNSGSGKSTLARRLSAGAGLAHLDLDTLAWMESDPPERRPLEDSLADLNEFMREHADWVIEGCYADLIVETLTRDPLMIFLDPGVETCVANARARPWEPHKYASREEQESSLEMLLEWIRGYDGRRDEFSRAAHRDLYDGYRGDRIRCVSNDETARIRP